MNQERGFNLIELMIVIAIMATLAAIALPSYSHYLNKGRVMSAVVATEPARALVTEYATLHNGDLAGLSNETLNVPSDDLIAGSHDLAEILISGSGQNTVAIVATLADKLGSLTWVGEYNPNSGNMLWSCTYPVGSPLQDYAPHGCEPE